MPSISKNLPTISQNVEDIDHHSGIARMGYQRTNQGVMGGRIVGNHAENEVFRWKVDRMGGGEAVSGLFVSDVGAF